MLHIKLAFQVKSAVENAVEDSFHVNDNVIIFAAREDYVSVL